MTNNAPTQMRNAFSPKVSRTQFHPHVLSE